MNEGVTFEQMKGSLGSLLLLWAGIERTVRDEVSRAHSGILPKSAYGIAAALNTWEAAMIEDQLARPFQALLASRLRAQLQWPLEIRNGVCHGLIGVSAADGGKPATLTWEINGIQSSITWDELQTVFKWLSKIPGAISMISRAPADQKSCREARLLPDRQWWVAEYGIDLPEPHVDVPL